MNVNVIIIYKHGIPPLRLSIRDSSIHIYHNDHPTNIKHIITYKEKGFFSQIKIKLKLKIKILVLLS